MNRCVGESVLSKTLEEIAVEDGRQCLKSAPVIVLGSGASIPFGLPSMTDLAQYLIESRPEETHDHQDDELWSRFVTELRTQDLESALVNIQMSDRLSDHIVDTTWQHIGEADEKAFDDMIISRNQSPLARLYSYLFNSTHRTLSVVTTNYDRLAEYAADHAGYCHYTGFTYGYFRQRQIDPPISFIQGRHPARTINIWKVHGCLDWFKSTDDQIVALASARSIPRDFRPAIVTPGSSKYAQALMEPFRSVISGADDALMRASAYLCIGFGFNDSHIQPRLLERWRQGKALLIILTKTLSESAKRMLEESNGQKFLALEESLNGTRMWSHRYRETMLLDNNLWNFPDFLDQTIGI